MSPIPATPERQDPWPPPALPARVESQPPSFRFSGPSAGAATAIYVAVTVAMTWPLATGLARDMPWDLGDSLLNCWILAWGADHLLRLLSGDISSLGELWHANIFYPATFALGYSEHLIAQAVQILPVYSLTGNIVLSYNLLFLSTFVLSGLGAFLLVRELTGSGVAGLVAGLIYAFAPYRIGQFSHVQVLSSQWMPFALYGLHRYFDTRRRAPLAGASAAIVAQNLSCGYFLFYFSPFVVAYCLFEVVDRGLARVKKVWLELSTAALVVMAVTAPFMWPVLVVAIGWTPFTSNRRSRDLFGRRVQLPHGSRGASDMG